MFYRSVHYLHNILPRAAFESLRLNAIKPIIYGAIDVVNNDLLPFKSTDCQCSEHSEVGAYEEHVKAASL